MGKIIYCVGPKDSLSESISNNLNLELNEIEVITFRDTERLTRYKGEPEGEEVIVICTLYKEVNNSFIDLLWTLDSLSNANPKSLTLVWPYFFYARQDREVVKGDSVATRAIGTLFSALKVNKVITIEIHSQRIFNYFKDIELINLETQDLLIEALKEEKIDAIISPDQGGFKRAQEYSKELNIDLVVVNKERTKEGLKLNIIEGEVKDKSCLIVDDMLDSGGTIFGISSLIRKLGAKEILLAVTHPIFSSNALDKLRELNKEGIVTKLITTNTIKRDFNERFIRVLDVSNIISQVI